MGKKKKEKNKKFIDNKKGQMKLLTVRIIAGFIIINSLPFLVLNPTNVYAQITYGFGNFLLLLGGLTQ